MNQLLAFFGGNKVSLSFLPTWLKFYESGNKILVIFKLWIDSFYVLSIFSEKRPEVSKTGSDSFS
jgi:hypothetical protein